MRASIISEPQWKATLRDSAPWRRLLRDPRQIWAEMKILSFAQIKSELYKASRQRISGLLDDWNSSLYIINYRTHSPSAQKILGPSTLATLDARRSLYSPRLRPRFLLLSPLHLARRVSFLLPTTIPPTLYHPDPLHYLLLSGLFPLSGPLTANAPSTVTISQSLSWVCTLLDTRTLTAELEELKISDCILLIFTDNFNLKS